jgi:hypothetical protein
MITSADLQSGCCAAASSALTSKRAAVAAATKARLVGVKGQPGLGLVSGSRVGLGLGSGLLGLGLGLGLGWARYGRDAHRRGAVLD